MNTMYFLRGDARLSRISHNSNIHCLPLHLISLSMLMIIAVIISDINRVRTREGLHWIITRRCALKMSRVDTRNVKRAYVCVHVLWVNNDGCYYTGIREKYTMYNELETAIWEKSNILLNCLKKKRSTILNNSLGINV